MRDRGSELRNVVREQHAALEGMLLVLRDAEGPEVDNASVGLRHFLAAHEAAEARAMRTPASRLGYHADAAMAAIASDDTASSKANDAVAELDRAIAAHSATVENDLLPEFLAAADEHLLSVAVTTMRDVESVARAQRMDNEGPSYADILAAAVARFDKRAELR